jgi:hypothetical protein
MTTQTGEARANEGDAADLVGTWLLQISTPFGTQPITFTVERAGGVLSGTMTHERGAADVSDIRLRGQEFSALAAVTLKGTRVTADIDGRIEGARMSGTVKVHLPIAPPVKFTGDKIAVSD